MKLSRINYSELNSPQKEIYNFQKLASLLAEYGFNCIKLVDDWQGADFLAYHKDGNDTLRVQLKSRITIDKKYQGKNLYIAFPISKYWCLIKHDELIEIIGNFTNWLNTPSWKEKGLYHSDNPNKDLVNAIRENFLSET